MRQESHLMLHACQRKCNFSFCRTFLLTILTILPEKPSNHNLIQQKLFLFLIIIFIVNVIVSKDISNHPHHRRSEFHQIQRLRCLANFIPVLAKTAFSRQFSYLIQKNLLKPFEVLKHSETVG